MVIGTECYAGWVWVLRMLCWLSVYTPINKYLLVYRHVHTSNISLKAETESDIKNLGGRSWRRIASPNMLYSRKVLFFYASFERARICSYIHPSIIMIYSYKKFELFCTKCQTISTALIKIPRQSFGIIQVLYTIYAWTSACIALIVLRARDLCHFLW